MRSSLQFRIQFLSFALAMALFSFACQTADSVEPTPPTGPQVAEIVAKSRVRSEAVESYASQYTPFLVVDRDEPGQVRAVKVDRVSSAISLEVTQMYPGNTYHNYVDRPVIVTPDHTYRSASTESTIWQRYPAGGMYYDPRVSDTLALFFPETFFNLELASSDNEHYVIEGFAIFKEEAEVEDRYYGTETERPESAKRVQLIIRKSDYALVELTKWNLPVAEIDENNEITIMRLPSGLAHVRDVYEFSQIDEGISVEVPQLPEVLIGL